MDYRNAVMFSLGLVTGTAIAGGSMDSIAGLTASIDAGSSATATSGSSAKFTGKNGRVSVNGDLVEARDGLLTVNGKPYGTVTEKSVVQYVARDREKILTVDGVPRKPAQ